MFSCCQEEAKRKSPKILKQRRSVTPKPSPKRGSKSVPNKSPSINLPPPSTKQAQLVPGTVHETRLGEHALIHHQCVLGQSTTWSVTASHCHACLDLDRLATPKLGFHSRQKGSNDSEVTNIESSMDDSGVVDDHEDGETASKEATPNLREVPSPLTSIQPSFPIIIFR